MNEILLLVMAAVCAAFVYIAWRLDRERLYGVMIIFLILISITGGKVVEFFGHSTNTGNIFYSSVFLATYLLIERYGKREGYRAIWVGAVGIVFFMVLARLAEALGGIEETAAVNDAISAILVPAHRIAFASLIAFICSQSLNVVLYVYLKTHMPHIGLWLRANTTNLFAQIVDSTIFFSVAFWGVVLPEHLLDAVLTGLTIKVLFMMASSLLLYLNGFEEESDKTFTSITWR
jgi:queuosine precursor transporter